MKIAALHGLSDLFEAFAAKPDIIIDDMPGTAHPAFAFDVNREPGWPEMVRDILRKHVDPRQSAGAPVSEPACTVYRLSPPDWRSALYRIPTDLCPNGSGLLDMAALGLHFGSRVDWFPT